MNAGLVDRAARNAALRLLAQWKAGTTTNWDFEDTWPDSGDRGVKAIGNRLWCFYTDFPKKKIDTHAFEPEDQALFDRCVTFLQSDANYQWPEFDFETEGLTGLEVWYRGRRTKARRWEEFTRSGDITVWPFLHRADYEWASGHCARVRVRAFVGSLNYRRVTARKKWCPRGDSMAFGTRKSAESCTGGPRERQAPCPIGGLGPDAQREPAAVHSPGGMNRRVAGVRSRFNRRMFAWASGFQPRVGREMMRRRRRRIGIALGTVEPSGPGV
jgi:hypothetical protein